MKKYQGYSLQRNEDKNKTLKEQRNISFETVCDIIQDPNSIIHIEKNHFPYEEQYVFIIIYNGYPHEIPFVIDHKEKTIFLKTIMPNRKYKYLFSTP